MNDFHSRSVEAVLEELQTSRQGLSEEDAAARLESHGYNELRREKRISIGKLFLSQFNNALLKLLILAATISLILGEYIEAGAIFGILLLNAILGFVQEYRANREQETLERMAAPRARILRQGRTMSVDARFVAPGDILILKAGDIVAADARLIESSSLKADESSLTGESMAAAKSADKLPVATPLADRKNMLFMGTSLTYGKGLAVVVATGMATQFGQIATQLQSTREVKTPLQLKFAALARQIGFIVVVLIVSVFVLGLLQNSLSFGKMLIFALALTVSTIPNSLPIIVTVGLSLGARRLFKKNMLIKKLPAAESLGAATIIVSDKTGTITRNQMTVTDIYCDEVEFRVSGVGYSPAGEITPENSRDEPAALEQLIKTGYLCNNAALHKIEPGGTSEKKVSYELVGEPTEGSLMVLAAKSKHDEREWKKSHALLAENPFDSDRKMMSVVYRNSGSAVAEAYVKGAPDRLINSCNRILKEGQIHTLAPSDIAAINQKNIEYGRSALRVLALAYRPLAEGENYSRESVERDLIFIGLVGIIDPPRDEVKEAVNRTRGAGIDVMIITGDHAETTRAIARQIDLYREGDIVLTGQELDELSDEELLEKIGSVRIIARALPIQKSRIVDILQQRGEVVAMTGDGVNDSLALKKADIGISMGITGSDISKEVSRAILVDDNFATIVNAIEEGRHIYNKMIISAKYLLSCNVGEITTVFTALMLNLPLPLLPLQILLMNLLTDDFPALGLGFEKPEKGIMNCPPRKSDARPISNRMFFLIIAFGLIMGAGSFYNFMQFYETDLQKAQTIAFTTLVMFQLFAVLSSRTLHFSPAHLNPFSNIWLLGAVLLSFSIQLAVIYLPPLQPVFGTVALGLADWGQIVMVASLGFVTMELSKLVIRK